MGLWCNVPKSYAALVKEIAKLRDELEDLRASAVAWRELYEAAAKRCNEYEGIIRKLGVLADIPLTGLVCPSCTQPVAVIENWMPGTVVLHCPACGHRWSVSEPGKGKH